MSESLMDIDRTLRQIGWYIGDGDVESAVAVLEDDFLYNDEFKGMWDLGNTKTVSAIAAIKSLVLGAYAIGYINGSMDEEENPTQTQE